MNRTEEATITLLAPNCPECGSPVMAARNPFYGVGLAVHECVRNCVDCPWYEFAGDSGPVRTETDSDRKRGNAVEIFWTRVNAAVSVFRAA